jgi:hypothetical protein
MITNLGAGQDTPSVPPVTLVPAQGQRADLARRIGLLQAGLAATSDPGERALILGNLGTALWRHFDLTGEGAVLDESIAARTRALSSGRLGPEDLMKWTHDLRDGLRARYDRSNQPADLDAALLVGQQVRGLPPWFGTGPVHYDLAHGRWRSELDERSRPPDRRTVAGPALWPDSIVGHGQASDPGSRGHHAGRCRRPDVAARGPW